jgi:nucleoside-diphosphate-sugar epimerase
MFLGSSYIYPKLAPQPLREFLYVDDLADACIHLMKTYSSDELVNIGTGEDITIAEFARVVVGYTGTITTIPHGPTVRPASCSTSAGSPNSAGERTLR